MKNLKEFYGIGEPIETELGLCEFIKVKDYPNFHQDLQMMSMTKDGIIYAYHQMYKITRDEDINQLINSLKQLDLYEIVININDFYQAYNKVFLKCFTDSDTIKNINKDNFENYRRLILEMNCAKEEKVNPNPEIQVAIERSKRLNSQNDEPITFTDVMSSVVVGSGITYKELNEMTVYQLYNTFHRIANFKGYDTSTLFATVATEKTKIESWSKHIDLTEDEEQGISRDEFNKKATNIFG